MRTIAILVVAGMACCSLACSDNLSPHSEGSGPAGNRAPQISPIGAREVLEGQNLFEAISASDPDGDTIYLAATNLPEGATFDPVRGHFSYTPEYNVATAEEGSLTLPEVTITVDDNYLSNSTFISITVINVNRPPMFLATDASRLTSIEVEVEPGEEQRIRFQVIDPDDDPVEIRLEREPDYAFLDGTTLIVAPAETDYRAIDAFEIVADDGTDAVLLPVLVTVGELEAEIPLPQGLSQLSAEEGELPLGGLASEGLFIFTSEPHDFIFTPLRLQIQVAPLGDDYEDGRAAIGPQVLAGDDPEVSLNLPGGTSFRWRARYLSDEFGPGEWANFGDNLESEADLRVSVIPETVLDQTPHNPSPEDVTFRFSSPNVRDFECLLNDGSWLDCNSPRSYFNLAEGHHTFLVRGVTREGRHDPTPATFQWQVLSGRAIPDTVITNTLVDNAGCSCQFHFEARGLPAGESVGWFECCLEKLGPMGTNCDNHNFRTCWPPQTYSRSSAPESADYINSGDFIFHVRAVNVVGQRDGSPATSSVNLRCN